MRKVFFTLSLFALSLLLVSSAPPLSYAQSLPQKVNLLKNGSFEDSNLLLGTSYLYGWKVIYGTVDVVPYQVTSGFSTWNQAADGEKSLDLIGTPGVAAIEQSIPTIPGQKYVLSGWVSHHYGIGQASADIYIDGKALEPILHVGKLTQAQMEWKPFSRSFVASFYRTTIRFADKNLAGYIFGGTGLDGLSITAEAVEGEILCRQEGKFPTANDWVFRLQQNPNQYQGYFIKLPLDSYFTPVLGFSGQINYQVKLALQGNGYLLTNVRDQLTAAYIAAQLTLQEQSATMGNDAARQKLACILRPPTSAGLGSSLVSALPAKLSNDSVVSESSTLQDLFELTAWSLRNGGIEDLTKLNNIYSQLNN